MLIGLFDQNYLNQAKEKLLKKYPQLVGKKSFFMHQLLEEIFNKGFSMLPFDGIKLIESFEKIRIYFIKCILY